jgi:hypothetical protein
VLASAARAVSFERSPDVIAALVTGRAAPRSSRRHRE